MRTKAGAKRREWLAPGSPHGPTPPSVRSGETKGRLRPKYHSQNMTDLPEATLLARLILLAPEVMPAGQRRAWVAELSALAAVSKRKKELRLVRTLDGMMRLLQEKTP